MRSRIVAVFALEIALAAVVFATPQAILSYRSIYWPTAAVGSLNNGPDLNVVNNGDTALSITSVSTGSADFTLFPSQATPGCTRNGSGYEILPRGYCSINVTFTPTQQGRRDATLTIVDNAPDSPQTVLLSGNVNVGMTLTPANMDFVAPAVGSPSAPQTLLLNNTGDVPLSIEEYLASFTLQFNGNCLGQDTIPPHSSCGVQATYTPVNSQKIDNTATIKANTPAPTTRYFKWPFTQAVTADFAFTLPPGGNAAATTSAGQTATYALQLTPAPGFTGHVTLTCSGGPASSTCTVSPTAVDLAGTPVNFTLSVRTASTAAALQGAPRVGWVLPRTLAFVVLFAMLVIVALSARPGLQKLLGGGIAVLFATALLACGTGKTTSPTTAITPVGNYAIQVTATSGNASEKLFVGLTVK